MIIRKKCFKYQTHTKKVCFKWKKNKSLEHFQTLKQYICQKVSTDWSALFSIYLIGSSTLKNPLWSYQVPCLSLGKSLLGIARSLPIYSIQNTCQGKDDVKLAFEPLQ